jgi:hypothetical protein
MRIRMTQKESGRLPGNGEQRQAPQVDPRWHEYSSKQQRRRIVSKEGQGIGGLIPRENKINGVNHECGE